ncbi:hypothetical protein QYF50_18870 [Paenibacillus vini]|uniref:hypothetical protein n=1 Tax=Paenibacillus vini TaxID=1476024 RepID=UPI0025B6657B|nr:hypothetical protein [Paenibacillus vini]MDN4069969.1 hypothetical protein [Paenibacillus vini]
MQCKIANCKNNSTGYFATVPVCTLHRDKLVDETIDYYSKRIEKRWLFESIRHLTPWKDTEPGDIHKAMVKNMRNGVVTIYEIKGGRYVLDHPSAYKGAKAE